MALDAAHRASIYEKLRPILGDEDANVLMSEFPSVEARELVTKEFLRAELAGLRAEIDGMRAHQRAELAALEQRITLRLEAAVAASTALISAIVGLG